MGRGSALKLGALDYETDPIAPRPDYPPEPVGCALFAEGKRPLYLAWGHPTGNNVSKSDAKRQIRAFIKEHFVICHNLPFDHDVGETRLGLPVLGKARGFHDTEILAYLNDPREESLALKKLADKHLNMPPDEQTELRDWICANVPEVIAKMKKNKGKPPRDWGAYIARAPGGLVGKYAKGDVVRTMKLFKLFFPRIRAEGMEDAYKRELRLIRLKLNMERQGLQTAAKKLERDLPKFEAVRDMLEGRIKKRLKINASYERTLPKGFFNLNSGQQVADAFELAGKVDPDNWIYTEPSDSYPDGQRSTSVKNLKRVCKDRKLLLDIGMHSVVETYVNTFLRPWLETGATTGGRIHPTINLIRSTDETGGSGTRGTKTGRPSVSQPNFNNIPANAAESKNAEVLLSLADLCFRELNLRFLGLRDYIIPDDGCAFIDRDYSQQEIRVCAHYENGPLMRAYQANPRMDVHKMVEEIVSRQFGVRLPRKAIKIIAFMVIYGSGLDHLAEELTDAGIPVDKDGAGEMRGVYLSAVPGIPELADELKQIAREGSPIRTWGGRLYYCEKPMYSRKHKRWMDFDYKMLNLLIQGGSADITKHAMLAVDEAIDGDIRLQVYDQIVANVDRGNYRTEMRRMREAMEDIELDVALPTDGAYSFESWARLKPIKEAA